MAADWKNGMCACCGHPGGAGLFLKAAVCPCFVMGDTNGHVSGVGGWFGGCACLFCPFVSTYLQVNARMETARISNIDECFAAACFTVVFCPICSLLQVRNEQECQLLAPVEVPEQEKMDYGASQERKASEEKDQDA
eukprot:TRINITY_DN73151_c0_g1_i1.p1 TRINITY_DN73151_c0_g1~~TRINITY_DN73151_c0_g1_i1.p1  ORF type:complete len:137 (-),score=21.95 TRINITY_DN73151_c0_g1_i1:202-612(-)